MHPLLLVRGLLLSRLHTCFSKNSIELNPLRFKVSRIFQSFWNLYNANLFSSSISHIRVRIMATCTFPFGISGDRITSFIFSGLVACCSTPSSKRHSKPSPAYFIWLQSSLPCCQWSYVSLSSSLEQNTISQYRSGYTNVLSVWSAQTTQHTVHTLFGSK